MMTFRQVEYLVRVAALGSIAAACSELRISQSSILAAIALAEEATGVRVFNKKKGHGVTVTPAGQKFLVSARRFLSAGSEFYSSLDEMARAKDHTMRIGCFSPLSALVMPPVIKRLFPEGGNSDVSLFEGDQTELRNWLESGMLDAVVTYDIGENFEGGVTPICKVPAHALLHSEDPLAKKKAVKLEELANRPFVLLDLPETRTYLMALFDLLAQRPVIALRTRSYETIRAAVSNGLGFSILNFKPSAEASPDGRELRRLPIIDKLKQPTLIVVDPYGSNKPAYLKRFISTLQQYITELGEENYAVCLPAHKGKLGYARL
jgi:DNA-binding transcriptional LysR family regulator